MKKKTLTFFFLLSTGILLSSFFVATPGFGQNLGGTINITRTPYLAIIKAPSSFTLNSYLGPDIQPAFTSTSNTKLHSRADMLPVDYQSQMLLVQDTRNSGGFTVTAQASEFTSAVSAHHFRAGSTTSINGNPFPAGSSVIYGNIIYDSTSFPSSGANTGIQAPVDMTHLMVSASIFDTLDIMEEASINNRLDLPVTIMDGCLPSTIGRNGLMAAGLAFEMNVPPYTPPGTYYSKITFTITDNTQTSCP